MVTDTLTLLHGADPDETEKVMVGLVKKAATSQLTPRESRLGLNRIVADRANRGQSRFTRQRKPID